MATKKPIFTGVIKLNDKMTAEFDKMFDANERKQEARSFGKKPLKQDDKEN